MSKMVLPTLAATAVALYFISKKRKVEIEVEVEPVDEMSSMDNVADLAVAAD